MAFTRSGGRLTRSPGDPEPFVEQGMFCDVVLEGGGVKGIALVGAIETLEQAGYEFKRVAGTSAGAIVGALVAAGMKSFDLANLMRSVDYRRFADESFLDRAPLGHLISLVFEQGVYEGDYLHTWLGEQLAGCGVDTFADLTYTDRALDLPEPERFRLVVMASDISQGRLCRLPWDYASHHKLDPAAQHVADAVRASMSIPFFYEPVHLNRSVMVDGGVLSNFPIDVFDRHNGMPRWPTFGIKLSARPGSQAQRFVVQDTLSMARALIGTMVSAHDQMHIDDPAVTDRTIFVDTLGVNATDFDLDDRTAMKLYENGRSAAARFLDSWDWDAYLTKHRMSTTSV
jgi:NTE family protein